MPGYPIPWSEDSEAGVFLFNQREYWCAHEAWEQVWKREPDPAVKKFYQGLIQLAAGYVKLQQRHYKGALANLRKGLERFRELDDAVGDLEVPIRYKQIANQSRGVRVSLLDQGEARVLERPWDLWPRIEPRAPGEPA
jgi:predicted metal-dependent hydrolase